MSRSQLRTVSLVGYTNAGKSTLLNRLTDAGVLVEDRLFATLDPRTRRLELPGGEAVLVTDTVGFVRKLPHQLVEAFRSTLEVVAESDLLVHVVDSTAARPARADRRGAHRAGRDRRGRRARAARVQQGRRRARGQAAGRPARRVGGHLRHGRRSGIDDLLVAVGDRLRRAGSKVVELVVPYERGDVSPPCTARARCCPRTTGPTPPDLRARLDAAEADALRRVPHGAG